ncbi:hypothetical protein ACKVWC_000107 [Pyricularia oryzae]
MGLGLTVCPLVVDLAWVLVLNPSRPTEPGSTVASLAHALESAIDSDSLGVDFSPKTGDAVRIMGIFTGQGAQWPAMLAVGISLDDARELVGLEAFDGRVCIAACNSPESATLSGDKNVLEEILEILQDEQKFARLLLVDRAYHSPHMFPCSDPYITALNQCGCGVPDGQDKGLLKWYSSVRDGKLVGFADITPKYWRDNLVSPALLSHASGQGTLENGLDVAVEVGPHPSLEAPASTTISARTAEEVPYTGCLQRGSDDVAIFAAALGYVWKRFAAFKPLDATAFVEAVHGASPTDMSKLVPAYAWDHTQVLWAEPRATKLNFNSYTFTDISPAFFEKARDKFSMHLDRMEFGKLNITKPPSEQWLKKHAYALIAASTDNHGWLPGFDPIRANPKLPKIINTYVKRQLCI